MSVLKDNSTYSLNYKNIANGIDLLADINNESIATAFFDPQYRGVLDKLKFGNEGQDRGKARCDLTQMDESTIKTFIKEIDRVLKKSGHLFLWVDKFHLCQGVLDWFTDTNFNLVDMVVWDKGKIGMGYRTRRKSEYLIVLQKSPVRAKDCWSDHAIPDVWEEKVQKVHPHSKPIELQRRLINATTTDGDTVLDPASGGYSVFEACKLLNRDFIGCDIEFGDVQTESQG
jgi:site-specific DNA-methyltransferase (adenine-specific)